MLKKVVPLAALLTLGACGNSKVTPSDGGTAGSGGGTTGSGGSTTGSGSSATSSSGSTTGSGGGTTGSGGSTVGSGGAPAADGLIFFDDFEGGDLNHSTNGFAWADTAYAHVTTNHPKDGTHALEFDYGSGDESWSEVRFDIGQNLTEVWIGYDIFIPSNYFHRDTNPTSGNEWGGGEKEFVLYADDYSEANPTLILGRNFKRHDGNWVNDGSSWMNSSFRYIDPDGVQQWYQMWPDGTPVLIDTKTDLGTWQKRILHVKMPTGPSSNDGVVEYWTVPASGPVRKCIDRHDGSFYGANDGASQNYVNKGYVLGYANSGFAEDTVFQVDNFEVRTNNRWGVQ
ncbi:Hypothetical protein A7982_02202 [Minicystis rosea]|nr:Hypothetical protein A7982_02202 [Minicystis rosea]